MLNSSQYANINYILQIVYLMYSAIYVSEIILSYLTYSLHSGLNTSILEAANMICLHLGQVSRQKVKVTKVIFCLDEVKLIIILQPAP